MGVELDRTEEVVKLGADVRPHVGGSGNWTLILLALLMKPTPLI